MSTTRSSVFLVLFSLTVCSTSAEAQSIDVLGPGIAVGITPDGGTVVGGSFMSISPDGVWIWSAAGGGTLLLIGMEGPRAIAADAGTVLGREDASGVEHAARWTSATGWTSLAGVGPSACGITHTSASDLSWDGQTAVGISQEGCNMNAFKWTSAGGMVHLPKIGSMASAFAVSADGATIGGWDDGPTADSLRHAAIWFPDGTEELILVDPAVNPLGLGDVTSFSSDASIACGRGPLGLGAWKWDKLNGVRYTGELPGYLEAEAQAVSDDGKTMIGLSGASFGTPEAWIWTEAGGLVTLDSFVADLGLSFPAGQQAFIATDMTPDGQQIVGAFQGAQFSPVFGFRLNLTDPCGFEPYGAGAAPANILTLSGAGAGAVGTTPTLDTGNVAAATVLMALSLGEGNLPILGGALLIDATQLVATLVMPAIAGTASFALPLPNDPAIAGAEVFLQSVATDISLPDGIAFSNGLKLTICP